MYSPRHDNPYLGFRVYAPSSRPLRFYHPYRRTLRIAVRVHPYNCFPLINIEALINCFQQYPRTKVGVSQEELNRFLAAVRLLYSFSPSYIHSSLAQVALLPPLHQHHQNLQHDHHLQQPQHPPHQADVTERENVIVQANAAEPELEFRRRRKLGDFLVRARRWHSLPIALPSSNTSWQEFILTLIILAILIAASHFFSN